MADDKTHIGEPDQSRASWNQDYEVSYLAQRFVLSADKIRQLIKRVGNDRQKHEEAARSLKNG